MPRHPLLLSMVAVGGCNPSVNRHRAADASVDVATEIDAADARADAPAIPTLIDFSADLGVHATGTSVTSWDDQSGHGFTATPATANGPLLTTVTVNANTHAVLRFDGTSYLTAAPHVPPTGTLFIAYSNTDHQSADRRVLGWEDTTGGAHGLGLIPDYHSADLALLVARNAGTIGDLSAGSGVTVMEVDTASWGNAGVTFERHAANGQVTTFASTTIQSVTDGGYVLHIGAPGDGSSGVLPFKGDIAALRVYDHQLSAAERTAITAALVARWL